MSLDLAQLKRLSGKMRLDQAIVEKDFALSVALGLVSKSEIGGVLAFKGGTCLKKLFFPQTRFSEDLDFTALTDDRKKIEQGIQSLFSGKQVDGISFTEIEFEDNQKSVKAVIKFVGPLNYPQTVRLDISMREKLVLEPVKMPLRDEFGSPADPVLCLALPEIIAEKMRALLTRVDPKDAFDLYFLSKQGKKPDSKIVSEKLNLGGKRLPREALEKRLEEIRLLWKRLAQIVPNVPDFDEVRKEVLEFMEYEQDANIGRLYVEKKRANEELEELRKTLAEQGKKYQLVGEQLKLDPMSVSYSGITVSSTGRFPRSDVQLEDLKKVDEIKELVTKYRQMENSINDIDRKLEYYGLGKQSDKKPSLL
jgi:predicted nucleotidyltransferase component of viral defense system